ncbi:GntR family transcriptional regulator [Pukyongiella litopenaei]|uniref:GntR family transcriptional regulator n=1 Tax=Pukyongiella litopenaei TaxID=2605946 RepID=A0A2S0MRD7_9RHOB|nr:GntR family transcriptional regulator [Pukyongiella litopenaei]AVO38432.1 GntR family transcriptional regulator [Pukyongiella litopenaei]
MSESVEETIIAAVIDAIAEQRLPAGTKLGEKELSQLFSCNRANVRRALASLAAQHVVELRPNRGAFVSSPTPKEAQDVFEARRAIERTIARQAAGRASADEIARLRQNISDEVRAHAAGNQPEELRLSRAFHLDIARVAGNAVLERILAELTMRTTLILGLYGTGEASNCAKDDHGSIVDALEAGDAERLVTEMDEHLKHLEAGVSFSQPKSPATGLRSQLFV